jgi:tellurite resistance protein TerB
MFGKLFAKKVNEAQAAAANITNKDLMEAIVAGSLLVAAADGEIEKSETATLDALLRANPALKHFGSRITETVDRFSEMLRAGGNMAKVKIKREIADVKTTPQDAEEAFACMIVSLKDFGIEATA